MDTINSSLQAQEWIDIVHASDLAAARRAGARLARVQGFDETREGQLAIVITEAATNILKHAQEGRMLLACVQEGEQRGIDLIAIDRGPGIGNLGQALRDGVSSAGTAGNGLGALIRLSDNFDAYAPRGKGAIFWMRLWQGAAPDIVAQTGALCLPLAGETESGDAWAVARQKRATTLMVVDGLGHGSEAAKAALGALEALAQRPGLAPGAQIEACHLALRGTRGAALAVAQFDPAEQQLYFAGVGNIAACIVDGDQRRQLVSHNGIVGHNMRKVQQFVHPCPPGALLILHSDGLGTQWDLSDYPGLVHLAPALIGAVLLRDHARGRDDACVLVKRVRERA